MTITTKARAALELMESVLSLDSWSGLPPAGVAALLEIHAMLSDALRRGDRDHHAAIVSLLTLAILGAPSVPGGVCAYYDQIRGRAALTQPEAQA